MFFDLMSNSEAMIKLIELIYHAKHTTSTVRLAVSAKPSIQHTLYCDIQFH